MAITKRYLNMIFIEHYRILYRLGVYFSRLYWSKNHL